MKLDKMLKARIRQLLRDRQREQLTVKASEMKETLVAIAKRRITAEWGDKQEDMKILAKYGHALPIKGANITIRNPDSRYFDISFGVEFDAGLLMPATGHEYTYWRCGVHENESDYPALQAFHHIRQNYENEQRAECDALDAFMRGTTSAAKVLTAYPWLVEHWPFKKGTAACS